MIQIRLKRIGKNHQSIYSIVVNHKGKAMTRGYVEKLGFYTVHADRWNQKYVFIDFDRLLY